MHCLPKQFSYVLPAIGGAILKLLHLVFSLFQVLNRYFRVLKFKWLERTTYRSYFLYEAEEYGLLISEAKRLGAVPHHLVIVLGNETLSHRNLINLISWSLMAGVSFISIYDYKGTVKKREKQLERSLAHRFGRFPFQSTKGFSNTIKNGSAIKQVRCLSLLDASDGKELIVKAVRKLCAKANEGLTNSGKPTQEELDQILIKESGLPEAQLVIYFDPVCSMYGFMPWHARIAEFLPLPDSDYINVMQFVSVLRRYNKCEQRFGK